MARMGESHLFHLTSRGELAVQGVLCTDTAERTFLSSVPNPRGHWCETLISGALGVSVRGVLCEPCIGDHTFPPFLNPRKRVAPHGFGEDPFGINTRKLPLRQSVRWPATLQRERKVVNITIKDPQCHKTGSTSVSLVNVRKRSLPVNFGCEDPAQRKNLTNIHKEAKFERRQVHKAARRTNAPSSG